MAEEKVKIESEMNRGFLQILVLLVLEEAMYGYMMLKHLDGLGYGVEESTLYPLLRRLEKNGLISSRWNVEGDRPRKFYQVSGDGKSVRQKLLEVWRRQNDILSGLAAGSSGVSEAKEVTNV
jgi:DNA-binding PadR family transcriptional regulator